MDGVKEEGKARRERNDGGEAGRGGHGVREGVKEDRGQGGEKLRRGSSCIGESMG